MKYLAIWFTRVLPAYIVTLAAVPCPADDLPPYFDLRTSPGGNCVSSVRQQQGGTCWAHGTMAAMESNLMMTGIWTAAGDTGEPNLAEYHLDWWNGFNTFNNDDLGGASDEGLIPHEGGDYRVAAAYLSRAEGAVRDIDGQSYYGPPSRVGEDWHYYYPRDVVWYTMDEELNGIDVIKQALMDHGAMGTCMLYDGMYLSDGYVHYQPLDSGGAPTHAVAIVGWNDLVQCGAPGPGAWICKNSWGATWGNSGYFWISYYDRHCGHDPQMGAVSFQNVEQCQYDRIYYHDYHGWRHTYYLADEGFSAFVSSGGELLRSASFYTAADSVDYTVIVYDTFANGELSDVLTSASGHIDHIGLHTVDLDPPAALTDTGDFFIYIQLSDGGLAYDRTSAVPVLLGADYRVVVPSAASPGESYYRDGGDWVDFTTYQETGNLCIKGLSDIVLSMECDTTWGWVPLEVAFEGNAEMDVDTWSWDFGDSGTGSGQVSSHVYTEGGLYDVALTVDYDSLQAGLHRFEVVAALADTLWADSVAMPLAGSTSGEISIFARNNMPLHFLQVPVVFSGDLDVDVYSLSFSVEGCRTEHFGEPIDVHSNPYYGRATVNLSLPDTAEALPVGEGPVLRIAYELATPQQLGQETEVSIGYGTYLPIFEGDRASYVAGGRSGLIYCPDCCLGTAGNVDYDSADQIDIVDLVYLVDFMFQDGSEPICAREADINGDAIGPDIADLVHLVSYMFQAGPEPASCE